MFAADDFLMGADVDTSHPEIKCVQRASTPTDGLIYRRDRDDVFRWGDWVVKETGVAGFRFDAVKHMDKQFVADFVKHVRVVHKNDELFTVGEFWKDSLGDLEKYLDTFSEQFSVFDTPLHCELPAFGSAVRVSKRACRQLQGG